MLVHCFLFHELTNSKTTCGICKSLGNILSQYLLTSNFFKVTEKLTKTKKLSVLSKASFNEH